MDSVMKWIEDGLAIVDRRLGKAESLKSALKDQLDQARNEYNEAALALNTLNDLIESVRVTKDQFVRALISLDKKEA
jgi:hypothetical protein